MNKNNPNAVYNKEQTYKQRLKKLVTDLKLICISEKAEVPCICREGLIGEVIWATIFRNLSEKSGITVLSEIY